MALSIATPLKLGAYGQSAAAGANRTSLLRILGDAQGTTSAGSIDSILRTKATNRATEIAAATSASSSIRDGISMLQVADQGLADIKVKLE